MVDIKEALKRYATVFDKTIWNTEKNGFLGISFFETYISKHYMYIKNDKIVDYFSICSY